MVLITTAMKFATMLLLPLAKAFDCTPSAFQSLLPNGASVNSATSVSEGGIFQVPAGDIPYPTSPTNLRALCAVQVQVQSSGSSSYKFGLFLPQAYNGRFLAVGNGGFAGGINWLDMGAGVGFYGFAVMSTDTGHSSSLGDGTWAFQAPEKQADWGYRAMHGSVVLAKQIVQAYYGSAPQYNYYSGCSTGGRQGLKEAQLYSDSFDGVLAGAPAWWTTHLQTATVKLALNNLPVSSAGHVPANLFSIVEAEVLRQCDGKDGLTDSIVSDPDNCFFDTRALLCGLGQSNGCLSSAQVDTVNKVYGDYRASDGTFIFPGLKFGSEAQWAALLGDSHPSSLGTQYVQDFVLGDQSWNWANYNDNIVQFADQNNLGQANANNFDMSSFRNSGGKLLHYHGLADGLIPTGSSQYFYDQVRQNLNAKGIGLDDWYRMFLVPGMQHCTGTPGDINAPWYFAGANQAGALGTGVRSVPGFEDSQHDALLALMDWVERGIAPGKIVATKWQNDQAPSRDTVQRQRPLCPYPGKARHSGKGDANDANNWAC